MEIDECASNPCDNGECYNMKLSESGLTAALDWYQCNCEEGWTGVNCDVNINDCLKGICNLQGTCTGWVF